jgi:hypothetical protein
MRKGIFYPVVGLLIFLTSTVVSLPRLAVEHGVSCQTCHISPGGGGMRNEFGNHSVALNELCFPTTKEAFLERYKAPRISESVSYGFDARYLVFDDGRVFRMQTDVYIAMEPLRDFFYQVRFWENGINEHYAIAYFSDQRYFVKAGRFAPTFGLHPVDHKSFIRERTGHGSNVYVDGIAVGGEIFRVNFAVELFNPDQRVTLGLHAYHNCFVGPVGYLIGVSFKDPEWSNGTTGKFPDSRSLFGGLNYDRFTLLGEINLSGQGSDTAMMYTSLTTRIEHGLYIVGEYNFFDGDRKVKSGVDEFVRLSVEFYPIPFVQLRPSYTYYTKGLLQDEDDLFLQLHVGY